MAPKQSHNCLDLLFATKTPGFPGTHFIDLEGSKAQLTLEPPSSFENGILGVEHSENIFGISEIPYGCFLKMILS